MNEDAGGVAFPRLVRAMLRIIYGTAPDILVLLDCSELGAAGLRHALAHELSHVLFGGLSLHSPNPTNFMYKSGLNPAQAESRPNQGQCLAALRFVRGLSNKMAGRRSAP